MKFWPPSEWGRSKKKPRKLSRRAYAAAVINRLTGDWITLSTSPDTEILSSLHALRTRSRQLVRDNDYAKAAKRDIVVNVIGRGMRLQARMMKQRGNQLDKNLNNTVETLWCRWHNQKYCDTSGRLSFNEIEQVVVGSLFESGEIFVRKIFKSFGGSKVPFALEMIESDLVDDLYSDILTNGNVVRMGVELDPWKRPVAYHLLHKHPGDYQFGISPQQRSTVRIRVPAEEMIHIFVSDRPGQTRGVPWMHAALLRMRHMAGYEEAEIVAARATASLMGFIQTPQGELIGDDTEDGDQVTEFEPGVFKKLNPGEEVNVPNLNRPGGQFAPFMKVMLKGVSASIGSPYASISADRSDSNYSSMRDAVVSSRDYYKVLQDWFSKKFHQEVFESFLDMAVISGELSIPKYGTESDDFYESIKWQPRGWQWVDPLKDVQANELAVQAGFKTRQEVITETGGDYEDFMTQRAKEVQDAKDAGISFSTDQTAVLRQPSDGAPPSDQGGSTAPA